MSDLFRQISRKLIYLIVVVLAFLFYGNTIPNEYALDDSIVITENQFTRQGLEGIDDIFTNGTFTGFFGDEKTLVAGGRYRPLSLVTFAVEYEIFGENPHISHLINILLYALTCILIFTILRKLLWHYESRPWFLSISFLTALFFLVHPVHSEVVANIKGRDEILALLFGLLSLNEALRYLDTSDKKYLLLAGVYLFLGLLSKENAITYVAVIPLTLYFFRESANRSGMRRIYQILYPLLSAALLFILLRLAVIGGFNFTTPDELMNNPFLNASAGEKYATIFQTLGLYLKLLIFPHPLTYDYYPWHIPLIDWNDLRAIIPLLIYSALLVYALVNIRRKSFSSYSILYYLLTLSVVSNLVFPIGTLMNERFLYMPSLGFCLLVAYMFSKYVYKSFNRSAVRLGVMIFLLVAITGLSAFKTIQRNKVWEDNFSLFTHDVKISSGSAKARMSAGGAYMERAVEIKDEKKKSEYFSKALKHLKRSLEIYPGYTQALLLTGNTFYHYQQDIDSVLKYYSKILRKNPNNQDVIENLKSMVNNEELGIKKKIRICRTMLNYSPEKYYFNYRLGKIYAKELKKPDKGIPYLRKALDSKPESLSVLKDLGVALGYNKEYRESIAVFEKALKIAPDDPQLYINQGINYRQLGEIEKASRLFNKARTLQSSGNHDQ
jgi:tetratricopeptide (TPR) repeat protein